jgi:hypothetical protein
MPGVLFSFANASEASFSTKKSAQWFRGRTAFCAFLSSEKEVPRVKIFPATDQGEGDPVRRYSCGDAVHIKLLYPEKSVGASY